MNISSVPFEVLWPFINIYKYQNQLDTMRPPAAQLQHEAATGGVQQKKCSWKFPKIYRETPMLKPFLVKLQVLCSEQGKVEIKQTGQNS